MNRVLVTGAQGFLGRYVVSALLQMTDTQILGCGRSPAIGNSFTHRIWTGSEFVPAPLPRDVIDPAGTGRYSYAQLDVLDAAATERCLSEFQPDTIFHLASALRDEELQILFRTNVLGTACLLESMASAGLAGKRLILASSGAVYGVLRELPVHENACCGPADVYGVSKLSAEHVSRILGLRHGIPCLWARIFNLVGAGQDERHVCGRLASQIAAIARGLTPATVRAGNLDSTRDYVDVRDAARALVRISAKGAADTVYNVASGVETPVQQILDSYLTLAGLSGRVQIERLACRPDDIPRHAGDPSRLAALTFEPQYTLRDSLESLLNYYLEM